MKMKKDLRKELLLGKKKVGIWGIGFIGFSSMANFAAAGVKCIGTDIVQKNVDAVNNGKIPVPNMEYWLGFDVAPLAKARLMTATTNWKELISSDIAVHLIAIPTEKNEKPWNDALIDVMEKLSTYKDIKTEEPPLVIIESTLTPNCTDNVLIPILEKRGLKVGKDILLGVAPRRDWFISPDKNLKTLPRIIGGTTPETTKLMKNVLSIICDHLIPAPDHRHAELVKSIENAYRHVEITLANQLSLAYSFVNMREILKLVGTKWNIGTFTPSFGTGGYCIPLSSQYVLLGTNNPEKLTILKATVETDNKLPELVAEWFAKKGVKKVGILGLSYKGNLKVHILSPTMKIVPTLKKLSVEVKVHDPWYTAEEIKQIINAETFDFPSGLKNFDAIIIVADHREYRISHAELLENLKKCRLIVDNTGVWKDVNFGKKIEYRLPGDVGWLKE